jgi:hypothetical protein
MWRICLHVVCLGCVVLIDSWKRLSIEFCCKILQVSVTFLLADKFCTSTNPGKREISQELFSVPFKAWGLKKNTPFGVCLGDCFKLLILKTSPGFLLLRVTGFLE